MFDFLSVFSRGAHNAPTKNHLLFAEKLKSFSDDEGGIATVWAMFWLIICFALSGLAIDVTNAWKVQQFLQSTADVSALAGSYELGTEDDNATLEINVDAEAIKFANYNMNPDVFGRTVAGVQTGVLDAEDVIVGHWEGPPAGSTGGSFTPLAPGDPGIRNAVRAITRQTAEQNYPVGTFFLRFVGFYDFDVTTDAIASTFVSLCEYDGLMAAGELNLTMGQQVYDEFCLHGEEGIKAAQGNFVSPDSIVSAPSYDLCGQNETKCSQDTDANIGFQENFVAQSLFVDPDADPEAETSTNGNKTDQYIGKAGKIDLYIDSLLGGDDEAFEYSPSYVEHSTSKIVSIKLTGNDTLNDELILLYPDPDGPDGPEGPGGFKEGTIYEIECTSGKDVNLAPTDIETWDVIRQVVIVGKGCDFVFAPDIQYYDIVIATDSTSRSSFSSPEGIVLGYHDGCDDYEKYPLSDGLVPDVNYFGGAITLLTKGSVHFASKFYSYDMEIIATNDVHLAGKPIKDGTGNTVATEPDIYEPTGINVHVGTTITTGGDIHVSRSHEFNGCLGRVSSNLFDPSYGYRLVW